MENSSHSPIPPPLPVESSSKSSCSQPSDVIACAGLPFVGKRNLHPQELASLKQRKRRLMATGCLVPLLTPLGAMAGGSIAAYAMAHFSNDAAWGAFTLFFVGGIVVTGFAIQWSWKRVREGARLRKTCVNGYVRRFEGQLLWDDPTDASLCILGSAGLLRLEPNTSDSVELLADRDEAYRVNEVVLNSPLQLSVTCATGQPRDAIRWRVPRTWSEQGIPDRAERRRPSADEMEELAEYGQLTLKFWLRSLLQILIIAPLVGYGLLILFLAAAQKVNETLHLTFDPLQAFVRILCCALLVALVIVGTQVMRRIRLRERIEQELELGWIIVAPTVRSSQPAPQREYPGPTIEYFPLTNLLWTIDGRPAGWRRYAKVKNVAKHMGHE